MSLNDTLELDSIIQEWNPPKELININGGAYNKKGIQTNTVIFDPEEPGTFEITVNNQVLKINVTDPSTIPDSVLTEDLVAWYRFEDGDARDYASNNEFPNVTWADPTAYDGSVNATYNTTTSVKDFESDSSGYYNVASGEYASRYYDSGSTISSLTVCAWIRINGLNNSYPGIVSAVPTNKSNDYEDGFTFQFYDSSNALDMEARDIITRHAPSNSDTTVGDGISTGEWEHVVWTYDSKTGDNRFYVDGSRAISFTGSSGFSLDLDRLTIGQRYYSSYQNSLVGDIDDVRIYNRSLDDSEVSNIYNATKP